MSNKSRKYRAFLRANHRTGKALMSVLGVSSLPYITTDEFEQLLLKVKN